MKLLTMHPFSTIILFLPFRTKCLPQRYILQYHWGMFSRDVRNQVSHPSKPAGKIIVLYTLRRTLNGIY
jgi:hypothetical protein